MAMTFRKKLFTVITFARLNTRRFFRDRLALFFTVVFPLIFLFVFGGIFGHDANLSFKVGLVNNSKSDFALKYDQNFSKNVVFKRDPKITTLDDGQEKLKRGEIDAIIVLPDDFGAINSGNNYPSGQAIVYYSPNFAQTAQTLSQVLDAQLQVISKQFVNVNRPFSAVTKASGQKGLKRFDYTFAGLLGFSIIGLGIFGPINVFPELKKQGILRRLHTTPLRVWQYFTATAITNTVVGLITMAVMFAVAMIVFHLHIVGNIFELELFIALSIVTILGIGLAIGGWAKNERQAAPLGNIIVFPMLFLSGTFFPRYVMPEWLQHVSNYLPLTPAIDGIRLIATEGKHLTQIGSQIGLLAIWAVVIYIIAFRVFRWE